MVFYFYDELGWSTVRFGVVAGVYGLAMVIGQAGLGKASDRFGRKPIILVGLLLTTTFYFGVGFITSFPLMLLVALAAGMGGALMAPALSALYLDITAAQHRSRVVGIKESSASLGGVAGPLLVALLSSLLTPQGIFISAGVLVLALAALARRCHHRAARATRRRRSAAVSMGGYGALGTRRELTMAVGRFLVMIGMLVWRRDDGRYLLLRRASTRDYAPGSGRPAPADLSRARASLTRYDGSPGRSWAGKCALSASWAPRTSTGVTRYRRTRWSAELRLFDSRRRRPQSQRRAFGAPVGHGGRCEGALPSRPLAAGADNPGRCATESNAGRIAKATLGGRLSSSSAREL